MAAGEALIILFILASQLGPEPARSMYSMATWRSVPLSFLVFSRGVAMPAPPPAVMVAPAAPVAPPPPPASPPPAAPMKK